MAYRWTGGVYEEVVSIKHKGDVPVPWGDAAVDLDAIRSAD